MIANAEIRVSVEMLRMVLDLPPGYEITGAVGDERVGVISLLMEAKDLPPVEAGASRYVVTPIMMRVNTGRCVLRELQIEPPEVMV